MEICLYSEEQSRVIQCEIQPNPLGWGYKWEPVRYYVTCTREEARVLFKQVGKGETMSVAPPPVATPSAGSRFAMPLQQQQQQWVTFKA